MASNKKLLMLPGDGIGPEVMRQVRRVIDWMDRRRAVGFEVTERLVGGASYDAHGTPLTEPHVEIHSVTLHAQAKRSHASRSDQEAWRCSGLLAWEASATAARSMRSCQWAAKSACRSRCA